MSFRPARLRRRGLDEDDVLDFCARVEQELGRLLEERATLYAEVRRLRGRADARNRAGTAPVMPLGAPVPASSREAPSAGAGPRESNVQAVRILAKAQQTAERCVADAQAYSREVAHDAQRCRDKILAEAKARATVLLEQAHRAATRAALGSSAAYPDQLTYSGQATYPDHAPENPAHPVSHRGPFADYPGPPADYSGPASDYPGPDGDYPGGRADYLDAATGQRRYPVQYDRFPF